MMVKGAVSSCLWYHVIQMASLVTGHGNLTPGSEGGSCVDLSGESKNNKCKVPRTERRQLNPSFPNFVILIAYLFSFHKCLRYDTELVLCVVLDRYGFSQHGVFGKKEKKKSSPASLPSGKLRAKITVEQIYHHHSCLLSPAIIF